MKYKILIPIIYIVFCISTQSAFSHTNEKWLPSHIIAYTDSKEDSVTVNLEYDIANRLTEVVTSAYLSRTIMKKGKKIEYDSFNNPVKWASYMSINDSIISEYELDIKLLNNNKIELKNGAYYTGILHLDEDKKMLLKLEETTTNSLQTKYVTTTFEYRNNLLYKRIENTIIVTNPKKVEDESENTPSESKTESISHTYEIETNKLFPFNNFYPRWLLTYFKIDDLILFPSIDIVSLVSDQEKIPEINISYHYNNENYLTGWTVIDSENSEELHCKIEYIKSK